MLGNERAGLFNTLASEIAAYEPRTKRLFVVNVAADVVDASVPNGKPSLRVIDISDPADPTQIDAIDLALASGFSKPVPTSVSAVRGLVAASVVSGDSGAGKVLFFDPYGVKINEVAVGEVPDMVTFSPDRRWVLAANAGLGEIKPNAEGGSISVIDVKAHGTTSSNVGQPSRRSTVPKPAPH